MTEKEAREWLKSIKVYDEEGHSIVEQILQLRAVAESCTVRTDKESIQTSGSGDKMANIVGKIVDLEEKLSDIEDKVLERRMIFEKICQLMDDKRQTDFLTVRYYGGNSFYETVMLLNLTDSTARRIERKGISEFTKHYNTIYCVKMP